MTVTTINIIARIRPITAKTAEELGLRVDAVASEYTVEGLVKAVLELAALAAARQT